MQKKRCYLSYRIIWIFIAMAIQDLLIWIFWAVVPLSTIDAMICQGISLVLLCTLIISMIIFVIIPYIHIDKGVQLFLSGYTSAGLKNSEVYLSSSIEELFKSVIKIIESDEILNVNKRQAQYLALQNQINPHFLYNTLESIRSEALEAGIESVTNMAEALGDFFRYTISKVENMVTLEDELQNVQSYYCIQKYRFEERVQLSVEYADGEQAELRQCLLPKLTLQPLVENSIIHGIERKIEPGKVQIFIQRTDKRLIIEINDDGVGMDAETLQNINQKLSQPVYESLHISKDKDGIALVNVNNRIHLLFGEQYGITLNSVQGIGTDTVITLPLVASEKELQKRTDHCEKRSIADGSCDI